MSLKPYQSSFIEFAISEGVLKFGSFQLKSGRTSPYFFNAGLFRSGKSLNKLAEFYAEAIMDSKVEFDILFGPAYKGIPLASVTSSALWSQHKVDKLVSYNRKEVKDHGEGGLIVGAELKGKILIIDDVITAGTAIRESLDLISKYGAQPAAVVVAVDRMEKGKGELSAIQELAKERNLPVFSIVNIEMVIEYLQEKGGFEDTVADMKKYLEMYQAKKE